MKNAVLLLLALALFFCSCAKDPTGNMAAINGAIEGRNYSMALIYSSLHGKKTLDDMVLKLRTELGHKRFCVEMNNAYRLMFDENSIYKQKGIMTKEDETAAARDRLKSARFNVCN